ncbi:response regulator [Herbaspirillum sp. WKF16]|jgi:two-component system response regulator|uniref:response regulator n=1 Tax=Herbaspirillum sp. WKF16 TaxID=3028312 RepID=UPI0023A9A1AE|nr:response regulator [Herbaspirillum sp. WKF16]WDZ94456.1 response regulator [Herbaspirillum sp. WKF16]
MTRPSILMIDPSPESVELARFSLWRSQLDCSFGWFEDAEQAADSLFSDEAAAQAAVTLPFLILLESRLPRMDGLEFLQQLRSHEHTRTLPVVMFSSSNDAPDVARAYAAGANGYALKPVDAREFMKTVVDTVSYWLNCNQLGR